MGESLTWIGILFCLSQSALFSGLNLAFFSVTRLRLEAESALGNKRAQRVLKMRKNSNFLLTTILWGNVGINVLLTMLSDQVMAGLSAFVFSTVFITLIGEILPQAYFSRYALMFASLFSPVLRFYQFLLFPLAWPLAKILDRMIGKEGVVYFAENSLREIIKRHIASHESEMGRAEGIGALNFLSIDDIPIVEEGEDLHPDSILALEEDGSFPSFEPKPSDQFINRLHRSGKKWVVFIHRNGSPAWVLDADGYLRSLFLDSNPTSIQEYCHVPRVFDEPKLSLESVLENFQIEPLDTKDDVIDRDIVLLWTAERKKVITGADILGRLMRGISKITPLPPVERFSSRSSVDGSE